MSEKLSGRIHRRRYSNHRTQNMSDPIEREKKKTCGVPSHWGRQLAASSHTSSPGNSILCIHAGQVRLVLPPFLLPEICIFLMVLMQEMARDTCSCHLSQQKRSADSISSISSLAPGVEEDTPLPGFTPHIQRIIPLSFLNSLSRSSYEGPNVSFASTQVVKRQ